MPDNLTLSRRFKRAAFVVVPLLVAAGAFALAQHGGGMHGHGSSMREHRMEMHLDHLGKLLTKIGATEAQRSQIDGILRGAFTELKTAHEGHDAALGRLHELLLSPSIDRARMESMRAEHFQALDAASKRLATAFADAAEVLSPEQRKSLAEEIRRHHND